MLSPSGGALYTFFPEFFGKANTPFEQVIFTRIDPITELITH